MASTERVFTKDGQTRTASTPADAVALLYDGWREQTPGSHPAKTKASARKATPAKAKPTASAPAQSAPPAGTTESQP